MYYFGGEADEVALHAAPGYNFYTHGQLERHREAPRGTCAGVLPRRPRGRPDQQFQHGVHHALLLFFYFF